MTTNLGIIKPCKYNSQELADRECSVCLAGLCSAGSCGYVDDKGNRYCNECWAEYQEETLGICASCGAELAPIYENQGWDGFEGPRHDEIVGFKPCSECKEVDYD